MGAATGVAVAEVAWRAAEQLLVAGAMGLHPTAVEGLARSVHAARAAGLHRLGRAGKRVLGMVESYQRSAPQFVLDQYVDALQELLFVAARLQRPEATEADVGRARRAYSRVATDPLALWGLCAEPIVTATGYSGVSILLCDDSGTTYTVSDVLPAPARRAFIAYDSPVGLPGTRVTHRALSRRTLLVQRATASADGRLGAGAGVRASAGGTEALPTAPFEPASTQLARVFGGGPDWVFLDGHVGHADREGLAFHAQGLRLPIRLVAPTDHPELAYRDNLTVISNVYGLALRVIGRWDRKQQGRVFVIAVATGTGPGPALVLPESWAERCNLGFDALEPDQIRGRAAIPEDPPTDAPALDPFAALARRLGRLALGGKATLSGRDLGRVAREAAAFDAAGLSHAADALLGLHGASDVGLATAWLAAATYLQAARRALVRERFAGVSG